MDEKLQKNIFYILQFIDSAKFIATTLSNLLNNLSEEIHKIKCKYGHDNKNISNLWNYIRSMRLFS